MTKLGSRPFSQFEAEKWAPETCSSELSLKTTILTLFRIASLSIDSFITPKRYEHSGKPPFGPEMGGKERRRLFDWQTPRSSSTRSSKTAE